MSAARRPTTVAVLYAGWLSVRVPQRGEAARRNLINVLGADVFVAGTYLPAERADCERRQRTDLKSTGGSHEASIGATKCLFRRLEALRPFARARAERMLTESELRQRLQRSPHWPRVVARFQASKTADGITIFAPVLGDRNLSVLRELHDYSRSIRLVEAHEARKRGGTRYARIVFSRLEFEWLAPHPPLGLLEPSSAVWLPSGGVSGGLNDRHALLSRSAADVYMKRWEVRGGSRAQQP